jgi:hypothetical protein
MTFKKNSGCPTGMAAAMIGSFGLTGRLQLLYLGPRRSADKFLMFAQIQENVVAELSDAARAYHRLPGENCAGVEATARRLLNNGRIGSSDVARILQDQRQAPPAESRIRERSS